MDHVSDPTQKLPTLALEAEKGCYAHCTGAFLSTCKKWLRSMLRLQAKSSILDEAAAGARELSNACSGSYCVSRFPCCVKVCCDYVGLAAWYVSTYVCNQRRHVHM